MAGGRPKKTINYDELEKLCQLQCTGEECASFFDINYDTLNARIKEKFGIGFSEYYKKKSETGKTSLRRLQWKSAQAGNVTMQVWLGKQYLHQSDKQITELTGKDGGAIEIGSPREEIERRIIGIASRLREKEDTEGADGSAISEITE